MKKITAVFLCLIMTAVLAIPACAAGGTDDVLKESVIAAERSRGRYYYNYLGRMKNGAAYQELYDKLYDFSLRLIESDMDFETDGYALIFNAGSPVIWEYDAGKLSYDEVLSVTNLFADDNPYFYFMEIMLTGTDLKLFPNYSFEKAAERKETFKKINSYLESYSEAEKIHDLYEKALFLHDRVCLNMTYSYDLSLHPGYTGWETNIYGPVIYRTGVCDGYAHIFCLVAQYYGFECPMIWGSAGSDVNDPSSLEAHLWNIMKLDTGRYYYVDTTWDDLDSVQDERDENLRHEFFLCGPENLRGHVRENNPSFTDIAVAASNELYLPGLSEKSYPEDKAEMEAQPELFTETEPVTGTSETDPPESGPVSVSGSNDTTAAYSGATAETAAEIPADTGSATTAGTEAVKETTEGSSAGVITIGPGVPDTPAQDNTPIIITVVAGGLVAAVVVITIIVKKSKK